MTQQARTNQVTDEFNRPVPGASIYVFKQDGTSASITSDGTTPLSQPVSTDEFGNYTYYAVPSLYREDTYYGGKLRFREVTPVGLDGVYPQEPRAGLFFAFDADSNPVASAGTGADAGLRTDLAATTGSQLVGLQRTGGVSQSIYSFISREKCTPLDYGATGDNIADDLAALTLAVQSGKRVRIPYGFTFRSTSNDILLPTGCQIEGDGGTINFDATGASSRLFVLQNTVSQIVINGVIFTCASDVDFTHLVRMTQLPGTTLDTFDFINNNITYSATPTTSGDRWCVAGTGDGTRQNIRINDNRITGAMQLVATPVATGTFQDAEICRNIIHNARSNAISLLSSGNISSTSPSTLNRVKVTDNVITADNYTSIGIVVGIDSAGANDKNTNIQNLTIARNRIDITASSNKTADIWIRLGNDCSGITNGFKSISDNIIIANNELHYGMQIANNPVSVATLTQITNFIFGSNKVFGGDMVIRNLADEAKFVANSIGRSGNMRLGENNGTIYSKGNIYGPLGNITNDAVFTWRSSHDTYLGSVSSTDRTVTLNANAGKVQTAYFGHCTIESSTTAASGIRSAIYTVGAGNPTVNVRNLTSSTAWLLGRYEVSTGSITDYTGGRWFSTTYDPPSLAAGALDAVQTITATGALIGDDVRVVFSNALGGLRLDAWVSAADTISFQFSNPTAGAINLNSGNVRVAWSRPTL